MPTEENEPVMFVLCAECGKSPLFFATNELLAKTLRSSPRLVQGDWPDNLKITDYEWDRIEGPSVRFVER